MNAISHRLELAYPDDDKGWGATVISMRDELVGDVRPALLMMLGAVGFVLLIACANVANLIFARALSRRKEVAIRSALGASRGRIVRPMLVESTLIAIAGGVLGLLLAHFGIDLLLKFFADKLPRMGEIGLNGSVLWFTLGLSVLTRRSLRATACLEHDQGRSERIPQTGPGQPRHRHRQQLHSLRACDD